MSPFYSATMSRIAENTSFNEKKRSEETQTVRAGGAKNFRPAADPLPGDAGRPKFNGHHSTFTYKPSLVRIDARNFELSW